MGNHVHLVVGVPEDPQPSSILGDFKSYASRALNQHISESQARRWWTESGSKHKLPNQWAVLASIRYVVNQDHP